MNLQNRARRRRGSALLVCTLAVAVLSMAAVAILRSSQRNVQRVEALESSCRGRCVSEGLYQRSIATLRLNPNASGTVVDPGNGMPSARSELTQLAPNATRIRIFLYAGSGVPAKDVIVDPATL